MGQRVLWIAGREPALDHPGVDVTFVADLHHALAHLEGCAFDALVASLPLEDATPDILFEQLRCLRFRNPAILHAPGVRLAEAVLWTKLGAFEIVETEEDALKAIPEAAFSTQVHSLAARLREPPPWRQLLIGQSRKIHDIAEIIRLVAPRRCTVLISGETGTGKEVIARCLHAASPRAGYEIVSVNCSAIPENLLEAELFGHVKGAFTGATANRIGRFDQARGSTLFLDEIGDLPMPLQAKLLRVLQEREFQRVGSSETIKTDVRVIAATNANLTSKIETGEFREDLYYRLNVVPIALPSLRERAADIPVLLQHFIEKICREEGIPPKQVPQPLMETLSRCSWPGNVRQLENAVEMAIALSGDRHILYASDFPLPAPRRVEAPPGAQPFIAVPDQGLDFERTIGGIERSILEQALRKTRGNKSLAAEMLHLKRTTLTAKLKTLSDAPQALHATAR